MNDLEISLCMFEAYVKAITAMMNTIGVEGMVKVLRDSADQLESNQEMLERHRAAKRQPPAGLA